MIHLALSIAAGLFLLWFAVVAGSIVFVLLCQWQTWAVLGAIVVILIVIFNRDDTAKANTVPDNIANVVVAENSEYKPYENPSLEALAVRLRNDPPFVFAFPLGEARLLAALPAPQDGTQIIISFMSLTEKSILQGKASTALEFLRNHLCGNEGLLEKYKIDPNYLMLTIYERQARVDSISLPIGYCG